MQHRDQSDAEQDEAMAPTCWSVSGSSGSGPEIACRNRASGDGSRNQNSIAPTTGPKTVAAPPRIRAA